MRGFRGVAAGLEPVEVLVRGTVSERDIDGGRRSVRASTRRAAGVDRSRIKMAEYRHHSGARLGVAQVNVECSGRLVRSQAAAASVGDAVRSACGALPGRLDRLRHRLAQAPPGPPDLAGEAWDRRESRRIPASRPYAGPARRIVRNKAYALALQDAGTAALTMDLRDYDFHLFIEASIGEHALVHRAGPSGYRLRLPRPELMTDRDTAAPVTVDETPLPHLGLPDAVRLLDADESPFLGFISTTTGRGTVLYRRFDGHLGIVTARW